MVEEKQKLFSVQWSLHARANLKEIFEYIKLDSPQNASRVVNDIVALTRTFSYMPYRFSECIELTTKSGMYRKATYVPYKIIFRIKKTQVKILSVFHASQNPKKLKSLKKVRV
jgi:plasmid stabilization system protein ParE